MLIMKYSLVIVFQMYLLQIENAPTTDQAEDELSVHDHIVAMKMQWNGVRNVDVLTDRMKKTYNARREQVANLTLTQLLDMYPALHDIHQAR
jgi:hypothetical protein